MHGISNKYLQNHKKVKLKVELKKLNCDGSTTCLLSTGVHIFNNEKYFIIACSFLNYGLLEVGGAEESWNKNME